MLSPDDICIQGRILFEIPASCGVCPDNGYNYLACSAAQIRQNIVEPSVQHPGKKNENNICEQNGRYLAVDYLSRFSDSHLKRVIGSPETEKQDRVNKNNYPVASSEIVNVFGIGIETVPDICKNSRERKQFGKFYNS